MKYRKLRIEWSVAWGVIAVLLCVLWVRSFRMIRPDWPTPFAEAGNYAIYSTHGSLLAANGLFLEYHPVNLNSYFIPRRFQSLDPGTFQHVRQHMTWSGFHAEYRSSAYWSFQAPYWFPNTLAAVLIALPWLPHRFMLRTLLIAMTLVAVVLGLIVYAVKS